MRRSGLHWVLAFLLMFAQEFGIVHLTRHAAERISDPLTAAHVDDSFCAKCAQYSANGSAAAPSLAVFQVVQAADTASSLVVVAAALGPFTAYLSRGPPSQA